MRAERGKEQTGWEWAFRAEPIGELGYLAQKAARAIIISKSNTTSRYSLNELFMVQVLDMCTGLVQDSKTQCPPSGSSQSNRTACSLTNATIAGASALQGRLP